MSSQQRRVPVVGIVFGVVAVAVVAAVLFAGDGDTGSGVFPTTQPPDGATGFGAPVIEGSLPQLADAGVDPAVGLPIPRVAGEDFAGQSVEIGPDSGPMAIVFLAHWCPHCQAEVPEVQSWIDDTGGVDGVPLWSVATAINSGRPNYPPAEWLFREDWSQPTIWDDADSSVLQAFGASAFPFWVFVDGDGQVAGRVAGSLGVDQLESLMEELGA